MRIPGNQNCGGRHVRALLRQTAMLLAAAGTYSVASVASASAPGPRTQVERGAASFERVCSRCHSKDLAGGQGPALKGNDFTAHWVGKSARALYSRILLSMPLDNPGSLSPRQVMDLAAFIISVNSFQPVAASFTSPEQMSKVTLQARQ